MAGLGRKTWSPGDVLTASDVNGYLMDQSVMVFAGTAARASAIPTPSAGMVAYSTATSLQVYDGSAWTAVTPTSSLVAGNFVSTSQTTASTSYVDLATTSSVTVTTGTSALVTVSCNAQNLTGGASVYMSFAISGATTTAASDTYATWYRNSTNYQTALSNTFLVTLTAGSNTFTTKFRVDAGTGIFLSRNISVITI